jgi:hypothetical protein
LDLIQVFRHIHIIQKFQPFINRPQDEYLNHSEDIQNKENDRDNDQDMNPITHTRESWTDISAQKTKQPQHD